MSDEKTAVASESAAPKSPSKSPYEDELLEHSYDGIEEFDNPLPRWWVNIFWVCFVFAGLYFFHYHLSGQGTSVRQAFADDVAEFEKAEAKRALKQTVSEASLAKLAANATAVAGGKVVYAAQCKVCHAELGEGLIGPNLTDAYWIHGMGTLMDIYKTVDTGIAAKGMPAWGRQLSPTELRQVVAFVGTIRDTDVKGKAPEGEKVDPGSRASAAESSAKGDSVSPDDSSGADSSVSAISAAKPIDSAAPANSAMPGVADAPAVPSAALR